MEREEILNLKMDQLRQKLNELQIESTGKKKADLQKRLMEHYNVEETNQDENSDHESFVSVVENQNTYRPHFTLRDIEESITLFSGNGHPEIEAWLSEYEDNTTAVGWDNLHKLIYAKQLMRGAARSFIRSQTDISNWPNLKKALIKEFSHKLSAADRHAILSNKKKRQNESLLEFLYSIIEVSKPIGLDEASIIQYFADGIQDSKPNKTVLYEAETVEELKAKIRVYERIKSSSNTYSKPNHSYTKKKCTQCPHLNNHTTNECKKLNNQCFYCGQKGHKSYECQLKNKNETGSDNKNFKKYENKQHNRNENQNVTIKDNGRQQNRGNEGRYNHQQHEQASSSQPPTRWYHQTDSGTQSKAVSSSIRVTKTIKIYGRDVEFLIDTGSDVNLLKETIYNKYFAYIPLTKKSIAINGIGAATTITLGYFTTEIKIDNITIQCDLHVVNDHLLGMESLLGNSIFEQLTMTINADGATFQFYDKKPKNYNHSFEAGVEFQALCISEAKMPNDEFDNRNLDGLNTLYLTVVSIIEPTGTFANLILLYLPNG